MSSRTILWSSVAILILGALILTFAPVAPAGGETMPWLIPAAYFTMLIGAAGLAWGWFKGRRRD